MSQVKRMWDGGPLRNFSPTKPATGKWLQGATGGFLGCYVCEACRKDVDGVYRVKNQWLGSCCKPTAKGTATEAQLRGLAKARAIRAGSEKTVGNLF